jgi:hypothetical protein
MINTYDPMKGMKSETDIAARLADIQFRKYNAARSDYLSPDKTLSYFKNAVQNPMLNAFDKQIEPRIREAFAGVGGFSSRQGQATGDALRDLSIDMSRQLAESQMTNQRLTADMAYRADEAAAQRTYGADQLAAQLRQRGQLAQLAELQYLRQQPLTSAAQYMQTLSPFQAKEEQRIADTKAEFSRMTQENSPWLQLGLQYLGRSFGSTTTQSAGGGIGQNIGGALGGALSLPMLGSSLMTAGAGGMSGAIGGVLAGPVGIGLGALLGFLG